MTLLVAPCSLDAARHAVTRWHYSRILPTGKLVRYGVWENDRFTGCVLYSRGASPYLGRALDLDATELCELTRIALDTHDTPVTQIVAETLRQLHTSNPGLRCVVSFADPAQGHHGGIYQAGNWIYTGQSKPVYEHYVGGRWRHRRGAWDHPDRPTSPMRTAPGKHRYLYPLDRATRRRVERLRSDPPRGSSLDGETTTSPVVGPGSTPGNRSTQHDKDDRP